MKHYLFLLALSSLLEGLLGGGCSKKTPNPGYGLNSDDVNDTVNVISLVPYDSTSWNTQDNYIQRLTFEYLDGFRYGLDANIRFGSWNASPTANQKISYLADEPLLITDSVKYRDAYTIIYRVRNTLYGKPLFMMYSLDGQDTTVWHVFHARTDSAEIVISYANLPYPNWPNVSNDSITQAFNFYLTPQIMNNYIYWPD